MCLSLSSQKRGQTRAVFHPRTDVYCTPLAPAPGMASGWQMLKGMWPVAALGCQGGISFSLRDPKAAPIQPKCPGTHGLASHQAHPEPCKQRSHPKCLDLKQLCQECSSGLPANNVNVSRNAMMGNSHRGLCCFCCNSYFSCWLGVSSAPC